MTVYVYGASDDLIEIEGSSLYEEFYYSEDGPNYLGFSDGTLLKITYDGDWNIKLVEGQAEILTTGSPSGDFNGVDREILNNLPVYSDLAIIHSDVTWAVCGTDVIK